MKRFSLLTFVWTFALLAGWSAVLPRAAEATEWTFLVYMAADNNLEPDGIDDFLEMAQVGSNDDLNIVVLFDRTPGESTEYGDWTDARRGRIMAGDTPVSSWGEDMGEVNMGSPAQLQSFVTWGVENYPANRTVLVLWNHGGGWRSERWVPAKWRAVCWDDTNGNESLEMGEVRATLETVAASTGVDLDLIGFDACVMGMVEVAYEIRNLADVMLASEESEPGGGWPYDTLLGDLVADPTMTTENFGRVIVDRYFAAYPDYSDSTQAAVRLSHLDGLRTKIDALADSLVANWQLDPKACLPAVQELRESVVNAVIHEQHNSGHENSHGLSINFPGYSLSGDYKTAILFGRESTWPDFLTTFQSDMGASWVDDARGDSEVFDSHYIDIADFCDQLEANLPKDLLILPEDGPSFSGVQGGPFTPADFIYTLRNRGEASLDWSGETQAPWLSLSPASGSLAPGEQVQVTLSPNTQALQYPGGAYESPLVFTNENTKETKSRQAVLAIGARPLQAFQWFDMETDPGWGTEGAWAFGVPTGSEDPDSGFDGPYVYGYNLAGNYEDSLSAPQYLTTPAFDCSAYANVKLSFYRWLGVETSLYDYATLQVSNDGASWTTIWENDETMAPSSWTYCEYDISSVADGESTVYIRWAMGTSDTYENYCGWNLDQIALEGEEVDDFAVSHPAQSIFRLYSGSGEALADVSFTLENGGDANLNWAVTEDANWLSLSETSGLLYAGGDYGIRASFSPGSLSPGVYEAVLTFQNLDTGAERLRSVRLEVLPMPTNAIYAFLMNEDPGWSTEGLWAFGPPQGNGSDPAAAFTGDNVYGYNLSGNYEDNLDSPRYLTMGPLGFSRYKNVMLRFHRWLNVEYDFYDQASIQASNDGANWTTVFENSSEVNDSAWKEVLVDISAVADGQHSIYVRWGMGPTDDMESYGGWNIDDVFFTGEGRTGVGLSSWMLFE